jgi:hypothetical protein
LANEFDYTLARGAGDAFIGVEVSWDFRTDHAGEKGVSRAKLVQLTGELFPEFRVNPDFLTPSVEQVLARATRYTWTPVNKVSPRNIVVRKLANKSSSYGVFHRDIVGEKESWVLGAKVTVSANTVLVLPYDGILFEESCKLWAEAIAEFSNSAMTYAYNQDISGLLVGIGDHLGWISRRRAGGVYFLPNDRGENFVRLLDRVGELSDGGVVGHITPQFADPRTLQTWHDRASTTFEDDIRKLESMLQDYTTRDTVRVSSFNTRILECASLAERVQGYACVLNDKLGPLLATIDTLKVTFQRAMEENKKAKARLDALFEGQSE